jgi:hypothetical protein
MPTCSTAGPITARRAVPFAGSPTVVPSLAAGSDSRTLPSAFRRSIVSHSPETISRLRGSLAVTASENIEMATVAVTRLSAIACRTMMSEAIEWPSSATRPSTPGSASAASATRPISAMSSCVVPSMRVTSPDIGLGLRPWPSKSND